MSIRTKRQAYWSELNTRWESSRLTQQRFCEQEGVAYKKFVYWRGRVSRTKSNQSKQQPELLKISTPRVIETTSPATEPPSTLEVIMPTGVKLYIKTDADVNKASALIQRLGGAL